MLQDWEGAGVTIFENHQDCWVIRIELASVDSLDGLLAYMNVFVRCNELVNAFKMVKVKRYVSLSGTATATSTYAYGCLELRLA